MTPAHIRLTQTVILIVGGAVTFAGLWRELYAMFHPRSRPR